jgi:uncharacterized protein YecE (DUF72 family)
MSKILMGVSSWSDPGLAKSGFYPPGTDSSQERLRYYSARFDIAESDASYHAIPWADHVRTWIESTPATFIFDLKVFSLFSGQPTPISAVPRDLRGDVRQGLRKGNNLYLNHVPGEIADRLWERFSGALAPLQESGRLGLVVFQFPAWFHPSPENLAYISLCKTKLGRYKLAMEFRAADWFDSAHFPSLLDRLKSLQIALVCVDEPQGLKSSMPALAEATAPFATIRFHGRNVAAWEGKESTTAEKYDYLYSEGELREWVPRIRQLQARTDELHVIFKNKHLGHRIINALQMQKLLGLPEMSG